MLTLRASSSRKVGMPNYGSKGASLSLELELDSGLINDTDRLLEHIRALFRLARGSVEEELSRSSPDHENGSPQKNGNGTAHRDGRAATASQVRALHAIASREGLDLTAELRNRFGVERPEDLLIGEASELIDAIKPIGNGAGGRL